MPDTPSSRGEKGITKKNIIEVLNAAEAPFEIETIIRIVDRCEGENIKELLRKGYIVPLKEESKEEPEPIIEEDDEPHGLLDLFG